MHYKTAKNENVLFMCVEHNRLKALVYLMSSETVYDVNEENFRKETILHLAAYKGYRDIVAYLLTIKADMEAKNSEGQTPLILATSENKKEIVKLLLMKGADRWQADNNGRTALTISQ